MKKPLLIALLGLFGFLGASAQPTGWSYSMPFQITNNTATLVTNYQAQLTVNTQALIAAGQMLATGNDIRFGKDCAGASLYNYWIESGLNTTTTTIWVKIDSLAASGSRTFYMFYGNPSAAAVSSVPSVFIGPNSSTDSVASGSAGGVGNSQRGFRFSPNEDILVTDFGKREPTGTTRYVTLFNFATQAVVTQTQVSGAAAQYSYSSLPNPVWLTTGTQYLLELYQGASDGYYFGTSSQIGQALTYYDMRYCNSCTQNTFPTNTLTNYQYGYPDFWYYTKNNVTPAPTVTAGTALMAMAGTDVAVCFGDSTQIGGTAMGGNAPYSYSWAPSTDLSSTTVSNPYASPSTAASYTVTVTDATGCVSMDTITVGVNPLPTLSVSANDTVCNGGSTTITATGNAATYSWMPGPFSGASYTVSPSSTTTYTVTASSAAGCNSRDSVAVEVIAPPVVAATGSYSVTCSNDNTPLILTASGATTYSWQPGNGSGATFVDLPAMTTTYTVVGTNAGGCTDTAYFTVTVNQAPTALASQDVTICQGACTNLVGTATGGNGPYSYSWMPSASVGSSFNVCPSVSTCYTLTVTDANGCSSMDSVCVFVNPAPVVAITGPDTICSGDSAIYVASGANTYTWQPGNISGPTAVYGPTSNMTGTLIGTDGNGCADTVAFAIAVRQLPVVDYTSAIDTVCTTDPALTLTGGTPAGGTYTGPGVSGSSFTPSVAGVGSHAITYSYTDGFGCSSSATHTIVVDPCTGVQEMVSANGVNVYPNPFSTSVTIERTTGAEVTVKIFDAEGKLVLSKQATGTRIEIETAGLANGIYSLQLSDDKSTQTIRLVKNN